MPKSRANAYTEAGVNIEAGNALVERLKAIVAGTRGGYRGFWGTVQA